MPSPPRDEPYSRAYVRYAMFIVFLVAVFNVVDRTVVSMLVPGIQADLGLDDLQIGLLLGPSFAVVHFIAILPAAWLADRSSRRVIIAAGLSIWSAMTALGGLAQNFGQLFAARMGVGIGEAAGSPPSVSLLTDTAPPSMRARALSSLTLGAVMGIGVGLVAGGALSQAYGWRWTLVAAGLPGLGVALLVRFTLREPPRSREVRGATPLEAARHLLALPSYRWMIAAVSLAGIGSLGRSLWEPEFLRRVHGLTGLELGLTLFLAGALPTAVGAVTGGVLADRLAQRDARWPLWVSGLGNLLSTAPVIAFLMWPTEQHLGLFGAREVPVAFAFLVVGGFFAGFYSPPVASVAQSLALPSMRALSHALWTMVYTLIGQGLGPAIIGLLTERWAPTYGDDSVRYGIAAVTALMPISAVCFALAARSLRADLARVERASGSG